MDKKTTKKEKHTEINTQKQKTQPKKQQQQQQKTKNRRLQFHALPLMTNIINGN